MKIYLVTDGSYSDYKVLCACSALSNAERAKEAYCADNDIQEMELDGIPETPPGLLPYLVLMQKDGSILSAGREAYDEDTNNRIGKPYATYGIDRAYITVWARDADHAIKIVGDKRTQMLAEDSWNTLFVRNRSY